MIPDIKELNFPKIDGKQYATLTQAAANIADMGEKNITTQVKIDGNIVPDFSFDWEVEFQGEKYIMPLRIPQGAKENTSLNSTIDLTFQHWAIYQLKRWPFVTIQQIAAGTYLPDEEVATVSLNLKDFCILFGQVLEYYYGDAITIDLNPAWQYKQEATIITISHTKIWNVLIDAFHGKYGVRWEIKAASDNSNTVKGGERYVIRVGYPTTEVDHIFEYGFEGGLLKVERQVQSEEIRNMLKGRGGDTNIPFRYFKDTDPNNKDFRPDPDWVEELANIPFTNLMPATFRSYVQGWKAAHISKYPGYTPVGESNAYAPWAYRKGYTDTKFSPVEFVTDEITINPTTGDKQVEILPGYSPYVKKGSSLDKYGPLPDTLDNNDDIYPTLQGTGLDVVVGVEQIQSDDVSDSTEGEAEVSNVGGATSTARYVDKSAYASVTIRGVNFTVPTGMTGNFEDDTKILSVVIPGTTGASGTYNKPLDIATNAELVSKSINIYNAYTGEKCSASGILAGTYYYEIVAEVHNLTTDKILNITVGAETPKLTVAELINDKWRNTFDIWVKNIWNSTKLSTETDSQYAERVWKPVLGDREGNTAKVVFTSGALAVSEDYEFTIVDFPVPDSSKAYEGEQSHWRITLAKSEAELEATGLYVPSTQKQGKAGDTFVFIGTEMTHVPYVVDAEIRLDDWKKDQLGEKKEIKPTAVVTTDRVRLNNEGKPDALINQLRVGNSLRLFDKRFFNEPGKAYETLYLQSITYTYREPSSDDAALNPDVEIVLGNEYTTSANPVSMMQGEISALQKQVGSISNIQQIVRAVGDKLYLRKDGISDRSLSPTQFFSLLTSGDFRAGLIGGAGWGFYKDENGNWVLEADRVNVRQEMQVNTLVINQAEGRGGMEIDTAAYIDGVTRVVETDNGYVCYFDQKGGSVANLFHVDDVAFCNRWTPENAQLKFYKRRVTAVNADSITLSKTDVNGTGIPAEGDNIIHFGNYTDATRQYVKVRDVVGGGYERYIEALNSVDAVGVEYYFVGKQAGQSRWFVGNKDLVPYSGAGDGSYIEYINRKFNLNNVSLSVNTTIGDKTLEEYIQQVSPPVEQEDIEDFVNNIVGPQLEGIQDQIDGVIESFFGFGAPTLTNYPANEWTTDEARKAHERDTYTDKTEYVDDVTTPTAGQSWKWQYTSPTDYGWVKIADSDAVKALLDAARAQDTANNKRRIFTQQPAPPYDKGDLWVNATYPSDTTAVTRDPSKNKYYNDILRCGTSRATGAFAIGDWGLSSNYTDDTLAQAAKDAADKAQADADKAEADAKAAKDRLDAWAADGVISPTEKQGIKDELSRIDADKAHITAEYSRYSLGTPTAYNNAHTAYRQQLVALSAVTPENITIPSTFASNQTAYYNARTTALSAIAAAAKKYVEDIAKQEAEKAVAGFEYLKKALGDVTTIAGGVMLSSQIRLGEHNADFTTQTTWAGHNGVYGNGRTIGSWWGGDMLDLFKDNDVRKTSAELGANARPATALIRMDGSSYFANGNVGFRENGSGWLAGDNIRWDEHGAITFGNGINIDLGSGGNTTLGGLNTSIASVTTLANKLSNLFTPYLGNTPKTWAEVSVPGTHFDSVKVNVGLWTDEFLSCLGKSDTGGSGSTGGGLVESIYRWADLGGTFSDTDNDTFNAYTLNRIYAELTAADSAISARLANFYTKPEADGRYALSSSLANYVTLNTEQTITARKNFSNALRFINTAPTSVNQGRAIGISWHTTSDTAYADTTLHIGSMTAADADGDISSRYLYLGWGTSPWAHTNNLTIGKDIFKYKGNDILHAYNYAALLDGRYVKKVGDTMTGTLTVPGLKIVSGYDAKIIIDNTDDETNWNSISFRDKGVEYGRLGTQGGTNITWNGNLIFHGGNYASVLDQRYLLKSAYTAADVLAKLKTVDGTASGLDADLLDGYHASLTTTASTVPVRDSDGLLRLPAVRNSGEFKTRLTEAGWYRVFTSDAADAQGDNILLSLSRMCNLTNNESYLFAISVRTYMSSYRPCITQLSGTFQTHEITKIRVVQKFNSIFYIDFYFTGDNNVVTASGFGRGTFCAPVAATIPDGYTAMEFDTVQGFKCNEELAANAATATKLADNTAFKAWGQTFFENGKPKNVSGNMTGVGSISASGEIKSTSPNGFRIAYANYGLILRNDGDNSYFLLTDSGDANGSFNSLRPFLINNSTGRVSMNNGMSASTATISGFLAAHSGVQIGADADTGWYRYSSRITAGNATAKGVNVGSLLVSDRWADGDKVPANGIYVKGPLRIGDITISYDAANGGLHVSGGGLYADTFISALGVNPNDGSGTGGGGGMSYDRLDAWADYSSDKAGYVLSALLGNDLYQNKLGKTEAQSLYQPKGSYVTLNTAQTITAGKTFDANISMADSRMITFPSASSGLVRTTGCAIHGGGDGASATDANLRFGSWYGIGWYPTISNQAVPQGENAMWLNVRTGDLTVAGRFIKKNGTSSQFLKADGSVDSNSYLLSSVYTASDVLNKLKTVDGAGSGLDADLLDGYHKTDIYGPKDVTDLNDVISDGGIKTNVYTSVAGTSMANKPLDISDARGTIGFGMFYALQLSWNYKGENLFMRAKAGVSGAWQPWHQLAYTTDTVANASALGGIAAAEYLTKSNYATTLDGRYYTETEINTKLTDGSVTKVGTGTVGATNRPIYLSAGVPTACSYIFGNASGNAALNNGTVNTNLNADMVDGVHNGSLTAKLINYNNDGGISDKVQFMQKANGWNEWDAPKQSWHSVIKLNHGNGDTYYNRTLAFDFFSHRIHTGRMNGGIFQGWKTLAFLDDNVASATKLQTARTLWGRSFDGTANVSGDMTGVGSITASGNINLSASSVLQFRKAGYGDKFAIWGDFNGFDDENKMHIGSATGAAGTDPALNTMLTMLLATGYIGLRTQSPTERLHVNGRVRASGFTLDGTHMLEWDAANEAWKFNGNVYATGGLSALGITELSATEATVESLKAKSILFNDSSNAFIKYVSNILWIQNSSGQILIGDNAQSGSRICMSNRTVFGGSSSGSYYIEPTGDAVLRALSVRGTIKAVGGLELKGAKFTVEGSEIYVTIGETKYKLTKTAVTA